MKLSPGYKPAATVLGAMILLGGVAAPAMAVPHPVASVCGGQVPDYVGLLGDDAPFEGKVALPGGGTADLSSTPSAPTAGSGWRSSATPTTPVTPSAA